MLHKHLRIYIFFVLTFATVICQALDFEYNGMWFELTSAGANPTCALTMPPKKYKFPKRFVIPSNVKYNGVDVSVTRINARAFAGGKKIKTIVVPPSIKTISEKAFAEDRESSYILSFDFSINCDSLIFEDGTDAIRFWGRPENNNSNYPRAKYMYLGRNIETNHQIYNIKDEGSGGAFHYMFSLRELVIGDMVTYLPKYAFKGLTDLHNVNLGQNINMIGDFAFSECERIEEIKLPKNLTILGFNVFDSCTSLKLISFDENIKQVEYDFNNCNNLNTIICQALIPPKLRTLDPAVCFNATLFVPEDLFSLYKEADGWSNFLKIEAIHP